MGKISWFVVFSIVFFSKSFTEDIKLHEEVEEGIQFDWANKMYSERLEGIYAVWTGSELLTQEQQQINAPAWFIEPLPSYSLDGILWVARKKFAQLNSIVTKDQASEEWSKVNFMLFDLPESADIFINRYKNVKKLVRELNQPYIRALSYYPIKNESHLLAQFERIIKEGGQGIILRDANELYHSEKNKQIIDPKDWLSATATIVGYIEGKGRHSGKLGAIKVKMPNGTVFVIRAGLNEMDRFNPPKIGSQIIYIYNGFSQTGQPRFAKYKDRLISQENNQ